MFTISFKELIFFQTPYCISLSGGRTHKMVLVANMSLKMGVGKLAAQVGHATLGVYRQVSLVCDCFVCYSSVLKKSMYYLLL